MKYNTQNFIIILLLIFILSFCLFQISFADNIKFSYKKNTLYWSHNHKKNYLNLQLDHLDPPTINKNKIDRIEYLTKDRLAIYSKDKCWILHYGGTVEYDWYVEDWFYWGLH